ncbi:MAG: peptidase P60, partial [Nitrospinaceae bacterium]|nr:peptidoglycan-binding protein [Nitrospinaceae bacterium]NIR53911.1 peptidoglycan-binding protein [Nitrospinaceae bacterium]NIS84325.1 peptidoglycan-binding protein [Nitrospinaceae bacterium]NIT81132.1 peptidoglycan-binding protein [Nitrospinaceae bacterium]NIU43414.1 peptidoglycan-binding protein [Nitrospinaceae bacterium]
GFRGREALWLQKNLRLLGFFKGPEAPLYGAQTENAVLQFQRQNSLKDDGKFHTESRILLYNLLNIYPTPKLVEP